MEKYIALLREPMSAEKSDFNAGTEKSLENSGFMDVTTYINSGNILFSANKEDILSPAAENPPIDN